jgi:hypothetical protein
LVYIYYNKIFYKNQLSLHKVQRTGLILIPPYYYSKFLIKNQVKGQQLVRETIGPRNWQSDNPSYAPRANLSWEFREFPICGDPVSAPGKIS